MDGEEGRVVLLTYILDPAAKMPLYEQLYRLIRQDISSGVLRGGERLPSKRSLAQHLEVSQITVETAYGQLLAEGYVSSAPRRGYFVQEALAVPPVPARQTAVCAGAEPTAGNGISSERTQPAETAETAETGWRFDFRTNTVDMDCFPFSTWARLSRAVLTEYADRLLRETVPQGELELREAIRDYLLAFRGIEVSAEQIIVGAGSEYLLHILIRLLGQGQRYALENPGYRKLYQIFEVNGADVRPIPLDGLGLCADRLEEATAVYLTPSHHFPTGVVMPVSRRMQLLQWAGERPGRYLIEDDYDSEFRYASRPIPALKELDRQGQVIYLNTFANSLAPSLRIGYMVLPEGLLAAYREQFSLYASSVPAFEQHTLARFMATGAFERHINRSRNIYKGRLEALLEALRESPLSSVTEVCGAEAGLHILLRVSIGLSEAELVRRAASRGVCICGLSGYYASGSEPERATLILGYAGISSECFREAVRCLCEAWL